jgi:hypothetical protein
MKKDNIKKDFGLIDSLYDISWQVTEAEYRKGVGLSYSTLSRFNREGFDKLNSLFDQISGPHLVFGSLVDTLLTGTDKELEDNYMRATFDTLKPGELNVVEYLFEKYSNTYKKLTDIPDKVIISATITVGYQTNWNPQTRANKIKDECGDYYNLSYLAIGKTIISDEVYSDANMCARILKDHEHSAKYFAPNNPFDKSVERFYQLKFKGEYNGIQVRCMADEIVVDHINKIVTPVDLKTSGKPEWHFPNSFLYWGYYIQAQLYWYIIRQNMDKHPIYKDYKLNNYEFVVISNHTRIPLVWIYEDTQKVEDITYGDHLAKNWRGILTDLNYYLTKQPKLPIGVKGTNNLLKFLNK